MAWHNHLPSWIRSDPPYQQLAGQVRHTLQTIADKCDPPDERGDLIGAFGGSSLLRSCGVSRATLFRHIARLMDDGYLLKIPGDGKSNRYAVPGDRRTPAREHNSHNSHNCAPQFEAPTRLKLRRNHHGYPPGLKPKGGGGFSKKSGAGKICVAQLRDAAALLELHALYVARGLIDDSEHGELYVFEAAENAIRFGRTPGALFWTRIKDYRQRQLPFAVSNEIADAARARWKLAKYGEQPERRDALEEEIL